MILGCGMVGANRGAKIRGPKMRVAGRAVSTKTHKRVKFRVLVEGERAGLQFSSETEGERVFYSEKLLGITGFFYAYFLRIMLEGNLLVFEAI